MDRALYEACRQSNPLTPEKTQILGKIKAELFTQTEVKVEQLEHAYNPPQVPQVSALPVFRASSDVPTASPPLLCAGPARKQTLLCITGYINSPEIKPVFLTGQELLHSETSSSKKGD